MRKVKLSKIEKEARRFVHSRQWLVRLAEVFAIVLFPLAIGILIQRMDKLGDNFWYTVIPLTGAQLLFGLIILLGAKNEYFFFEYTDLQDSHQDLVDKQSAWHFKKHSVRFHQGSHLFRG